MLQDTDYADLPRVNGNRVRLRQALCKECDGGHLLVRAVFMGVKEEVKAVCAELAMRNDVKIADHDTLSTLKPNHSFSQTRAVTLTPNVYAAYRFQYPDIVQSVICGRAGDLPFQAFPVFSKIYCHHIPVIEDFATILWDLAVEHGYAEQLETFGLDSGLEAYLLNLPSPEKFEPHLMNVLPELAQLAPAA